MFFGRIVRNIFIFLLIFVLTVNIYLWSMYISGGQTGTFKYTGFYNFFKNFENMPRFEYFISMWKHLADMFTKWSAWQTALAIFTGGISTVAEFTVKLTELVVTLFIEFFRYIIWLFGFIGADTSVIKA